MYMYTRKFVKTDKYYAVSRIPSECIPIFRVHIHDFVSHFDQFSCIAVHDYFIPSINPRARGYTGRAGRRGVGLGGAGPSVCAAAGGGIARRARANPPPTPPAEPPKATITTRTDAEVIELERKTGNKRAQKHGQKNGKKKNGENGKKKYFFHFSRFSFFIFFSNSFQIRPGIFTGSMFYRIGGFYGSLLGVLGLL